MTKDYFIADDLSGALDAAGAFHRAGRRVEILLSLEAWAAYRWTGDEVVALTTETRNAPPVQAAATVTRALELGRSKAATLVYKKIDSTLRGAVAAEVQALTRALPEAHILFLPANPAVGRTVQGGVLRVHGVPVAETEFARDPVSPVRVSAIRELLGEAAGPRVTIADAMNEADLAAAVAKHDALGRLWVGIGSGALARPVAARLQRERTILPRAEPLPLGAQLMVCGSGHRLNREQASALAHARGIPVHELTLDAAPAARAAAEASLRTHGGAGLAIEERRGDSAAVVRTMAATVAALMQTSPVRRLFATGGETAFAICQQLGISALTFAREIEPGVCLARACGRGGEIALAMKPGGFGDAQTWIRAWDALRET